MCESNVYLNREGNEELVMERVDRIVPGLDDNVFLENIFGERKVLRARIKEMELVHHRIVLEEIPEEQSAVDTEIWIEPQTDHGHFHAGEDVALKVMKGYNMKPSDLDISQVRAVMVNEDGQNQVEIHMHHGVGEINIGHETDGLIQLFVQENTDKDRYGKIVLEIGHHHHHELQPLGLPLEIVPCGYSHARMGEQYEIVVLKDGAALPGVEVKATFAGTHSPDYPHRLITGSDGKTRLFLSARGNYLFTVSVDNVISTFTLVKSF
ncbi:MAG TPA: CooT family nickel-binding protein [Syntrophomonadaceae bacterium]|nr:CooT family nickel-binding protein [Syntrophomonadaceae bacterium]